MRLKTLLLPATGLFVLVLAFNLPASLVANRVQPPMALQGVYGTIFNGGADSVTFNNRPLGALDWSFNPGSLLRAAVGYQVTLQIPPGVPNGAMTAPPGHAEALVEWHAGNKIVLKDLSMSMGLATVRALAGQSDSLIGTGDLRVNMPAVELLNGWPSQLKGQIEFLHLHPPMLAATVGDFAVQFDESPRREDNEIIGTVRDTSGSLGLNATLHLKADRTYLVDGTLLARGGAAADLTDLVNTLGPPDANGARAFSMSGAFQP